jgi:hypothetical protein
MLLEEKIAEKVAFLALCLLFEQNKLETDQNPPYY